MSRDYKNRIPAYRQARYRAWPPSGVLVGAVAALAVIAALGFYFVTLHEPGTSAPPPDAIPGSASGPPRSKADPAPAAEAEAPARAGADRPPPLPEPRFTFYKILPEKEVVIAENEIRALKGEESRGKPAGTLYLLQAGSFTSRQDADKLKAQLAGIKVKAKLELIKLDNATWYRVKIGPYATLADADRVRQHLRANKIDSIIQKAAASR